MTKRQYDQFCPAACALDIIGERWAMLIVRELILGPKRFVDILAGLPGIGTNTLTSRLEELEAAGVIAKRRLPAAASSTAYALTARGRELEPILEAVARWGAPYLQTATPRHGLRASWLGFALRTFFRAEPVKKLTATVELVLPTGTLSLHFDRGTLRVVEAEAEAPDLRLFASEQTIAGLLTGGMKVPAGTDLRAEGDESLLGPMIQAFPLAIEPVG